MKLKIITLTLFFIVYLNRGQSDNEKLTGYVNPFIGTSNYGYTFPATVVQWVWFPSVLTIHQVLRPDM